MTELRDNSQIVLELTADELLLVNNALNEVCNGPDAIPDWEFRTRMGVERAEALRLLRRVHDELVASTG